MKKTQTSVEYLIILAMVIIITLLIISTNENLREFVADKEKNNPSLWNEAEIGIKDGMVGNVSFIKIKNNLPYTITITNITLSDTSDKFHILQHNITLKKHNTNNFNFSSLINCHGRKYYPLNIKINYTDNIGIEKSLDYGTEYNFECN
ncbi:MAG: hypothetical protein ACQER9_04840 [Nanobdellota archaeon]